MYCRNCGAPLADNAVVCARCGATVTPPAPPPGTQQPYQSQQQPYHPPYYQYPYGQQPYPQQEDRPSAGFHVLAFFFPIVGLILYLVWKDQKAALCACHRQMGADWLYCQYDTHNYWHRIFPFAL